MAFQSREDDEAWKRRTSEEMRTSGNASPMDAVARERDRRNYWIDVNLKIRRADLDEIAKNARGLEGDRKPQRRLRPRSGELDSSSLRSSE